MLTLADVGQSVGRLSALKVRQIWRHALRREGNPDPAAGLSPGECLVLWTAGVLAARNLLSPDQQAAVIEEFAESIKSYGDVIGADIEARRSSKQFPGRCIKVGVLTILDCGLVRMTEQDDYFDVRLARRVPSPQRPPVEFLSIDLAALYVRFLSNLLTRSAESG